MQIFPRLSVPRERSLCRFFRRVFLDHLVVFQSHPIFDGLRVVVALVAWVSLLSAPKLTEWIVTPSEGTRSVRQASTRTMSESQPIADALRKELRATQMAIPRSHFARVAEERTRKARLRADVAIKVFELKVVDDVPKE